MTIRLLIQIFALISMTLATNAQTYFYVAPGGNDGNPGTEALPWGSVQKACDAAVPGSRVLIRSGIYNEKVTMNVSGTAEGGSITFEPYPGETVIIDGTGKAGDQLILLVNKRYIIIRGLELRNNLNQSFGTGIWIQGYGDHIELRDLIIHNMRADAGGGDAMALSVYGSHPTMPISNVVIDGNHIFDCEPGHSEAVALNGNIDSFAITNNILHDVNNIGIVMIGGEKTCPTPALDAARNGVCAGNIVYNARSSYGGGYAAGIYVDGGRNITVERNRVYQCDLGIEIGCENKGCIASGMIVRNNLLYNNDKAGLGFGGYNYPQTGKVINSWFINNTCFRNDKLMTEAGELWIQYAEGCTVRNSIFSAGSQNRLLTTMVGNALGLSIDYNLWDSPSGPAGSTVDFNGSVFISFDAYQTATGQDAHSAFAVPLFISSALPDPDLHLQAGSPARDAGDIAAHTQSGTLDYDGHLRILNGRIDMGAIEQVVSVPGDPSAPQLLSVVGSPGSAMVRWKRNPEADIARYLLYADTVSPPLFRYDSTGMAVDTSWALSNLLNEHRYYIRISAVDIDGNEGGLSNELSCVPTVFTEVPDPPQQVKAARGIDSLHILLVWKHSEQALRYDCEVGTGPSFTTTIWNSASLGDSFAIAEVPASGVYFWRVRGINTIGIGNWSPVWNFAASPASFTFTAYDRWNLLSAPIQTTDRSTASIFPSAISDVFAQSPGGYIQVDSLPGQYGFWLKFQGVQEIGVGGDSTLTDTVHVKPGWNLIGSISVPVPTSTIISNPPSLLTSKFYAFDRIYYPTATLLPFLGHWVKTDVEADLILAPPTAEPMAGRIHIRTGDDTPPPPPGHVHDQAFAPVISREWRLEPNFPNPFNPSTTIRFSLPRKERVLLQVYDALGRLLTTLINADVEAGTRSVVWDGSMHPSGIYVCQLVTEGNVEQRAMILLK